MTDYNVSILVKFSVNIIVCSVLILFQFLTIQSNNIPAKYACFFKNGELLHICESCATFNGEWRRRTKWVLSNSVCGGPGREADTLDMQEVFYLEVYIRMCHFRVCKNN